MSIELNHTIVRAHDPKASAQFLAGVLGLAVDPPVAHFTPVALANSVSLVPRAGCREEVAAEGAPVRTLDFASEMQPVQLK